MAKRLEQLNAVRTQRRRRGLDRAEPLSAPIGADANESRHADQLPMESWIHGSTGIFIYSDRKNEVVWVKGGGTATGFTSAGQQTF